MSLSSYLFERHQSLTHQFQERLATWRSAYHRLQSRAGQRPALFDPLEPRMLMSANVVTYTDASGDLVTVKLTGPGSLVVAGVTDSSQVDASGITLTGTTTKSSLSITVKNADKKVIATTTLGSINIGTGQLASLSAGSVDLTGAGLICDVGSTNSYINVITLRDLSGGADILLNHNTSTTTSTTKITARLVGDGSDISLNNAISSATFADVGDGTLSATKLSALKVTGIKGDSVYVGNFYSDITLAGGTGTLLGGVTIAGSINHTTWTVSGAGSSLKVGGSFAADVTINKLGAVTVGGAFSGSLILGAGITRDDVGVLSSLTVGGAMTGSVSSTHGSTGTIKAASANGAILNIANGTINRIDITGDMVAGSVTAGRIGSWEVDGNLSNLGANITITGKTGYTVVNSITVGGAISSTYIQAVSGGLGSLKAGSIGTSTFDFSAGRIGSITVANNMSGHYTVGSVDLNTIKAISIGTWTVKGNLDTITAAIGTDSKLDGKQALDKLAVTGSLTDTNIEASYGGAGAISAGSTNATTLLFANGNIGSITVNGTQNGGTIKARAINTWSVKTDLTSVTATLAETKDMTKYYVLTKLSVGGNVTGTNVSAATGQVGTISAGTISGSNLVFTAGRINTLSTTGTMNQLTLTAASIGKWSVGGDLTNVTADLGASSSLNGYYTITDLLVTGDVKTVSVDIDYGGIRTLSAKSISTNSNFHLPNGRINTLKTTAGDMADTDVTAKTIGTWSVGGNTDSLNVTLGASDVTSKTFSLEKLTVTGSMTDTTIDASYGAAGDISAQSMANGLIRFSKGSIRSLKISGSMTSTDNTKLQLQATSIGTWTVGGNLTKSNAVFGASDDKEYYALGTLTVTGAMTDTNISSAEDGAYSISANAISGGSLDFKKSTIAYLNSTQSTDTLSIYAKTVMYWTVGGNLLQTNAYLGNSTTENSGGNLTDVLWYLTVKGTMNQDNIYADGTINSIQAKKMTNSNVFAGYTDSGSGFALHTNEEIVSIVVTGDGEGSFVGNSIKATWVDTLNVYDPSSSTVTLNGMRDLRTTQYNSGSAQSYHFGGGRTWFSSTPANSDVALAGLTLTWVDKV